MALQGLWGSVFSFEGGLFKNPSRFWSRVSVVASEPVVAAEVTANHLQEKVSELRGTAA